MTFGIRLQNLLLWWENITNCIVCCLFSYPTLTLWGSPRGEMFACMAALFYPATSAAIFRLQGIKLYWRLWSQKITAKFLVTFCFPRPRFWWRLSRRSVKSFNTMGCCCLQCINQFDFTECWLWSVIFFLSSPKLEYGYFKSKIKIKIATWTGLHLDY